MNDREDAAAFFGKVTASTTHELQNVLAIIKENAGLMEDFIQMGPENLPDLLERVTRCLGKIKEQSYRGVALTSGLNGFAHTTDRLLGPVNIYEIAKRLIFLTKRVFLQQGRQIVLSDCKNAPSFETDPVLFQTLLWHCLECLVEIQDLTADIRLTIVNSDTGKGIDLCFEDPALDNASFNQQLQGSAKWASIQASCKTINLTISPIAQAPMGIRILLERPLSKK
jgi:C4-dicarboxylate-specific signal transduction histidine kinase